nr:MAG: ORF1 [TTV-like mini virus]
MAYYYRRWKPRWRRRRRRFWTWRARGPFRKRWRRRHWVRKRKFKSLPLRQWQPACIRKFSVKGIYCLFQANHKRLNKNWAQYEDSIIPEGIPGGGGYGIHRFNLDCLYQQNQRARNIWTKSNKYLPMIRYLGCEFKIYRPQECDAVVKFQNCFPFTATALTYTGAQPSMLMMSRGSKKIRCKRNAPNLKPYKRFRFPPPQQMKNSWFLQADIVNTGLIMLTSTAASFDQYFISTSAESNNISFKALNTRVFQNRNFKTIPTNGYSAKDNFWLWATNGDENPKIKDLHFLGNTNTYQKGKYIQQLQGSTLQEKLKYFTLETWGNPFHEEFIQKKHRLWFTTVSPFIKLSATGLTLETDIKQNGWTEVEQELIWDCRYNPQKDTGKDTAIYLLPNWVAKIGWEPLLNDKIKLEGFPLWLIVTGFIDYQQKLGEVHNVLTHYITVIKSKAIEPQFEYYVLLDNSFFNGDSEFLQGRTYIDEHNWYPMSKYQDLTLENIYQSGPATAKLGKNVTAELHCEYTFRFKLGGCVPPMDKVKNPADQPHYPVPNILIDSNSLQSPSEPIENFLYQFDERWGQITKTAAERITKDRKPKRTIFSDSTTTGTTDVPVLQALQEKEDSTSEEETEEETLFDQLNRQRLKQQQLRQRIKLLLNKLQNLS